MLQHFIFISHLPELININPFSGCLQLQLPVPCKAMSCPFLEHPQSYAVATALSHQNAQIPLIKSSIIIWPASNPSAIHLIIWWLSKGWERWNEAPNISYQSFCNAGFNITASSGALIGLISLVYASDYAYFRRKTYASDRGTLTILSRIATLNLVFVSSLRGSQILGILLWRIWIYSSLTSHRCLQSNTYI